MCTFPKAEAKLFKNSISAKQSTIKWVMRKSLQKMNRAVGDFTEYFQFYPILIGSYPSTSCKRIYRNSLIPGFQSQKRKKVCYKSRDTCPSIKQ